MGKSLYRSYRSTNLDEIVGQDHIVNTLKNALKNKAIAHAYLLSGPRGVGKTSVARILAYEVNEQPYDLEKTHLDIIEIDAASNRRIDEVREIRDKVRIAPSTGKYKVYIIDEVHMLTKEAFNALLKTLEEPPEHAIFILATTESHKLPETIISRCIHFSFKPIPVNVLKNHLREISSKENINISDEALEILAKHSRGSFRDSISLLEQVKFISSNISKTDVSLMLGITPEDTIAELITNIESGDIVNINQMLVKAREYGVSSANLASDLQERLREIILNPKLSRMNPSDILKLQYELLEVSGSDNPDLKLEIILSRFALKNTAATTTKNEIDSSKNVIPKKQSNVSAPQKIQTISITPPKRDNSEGTGINNWTRFLNELKKQNSTLYGVLRLARAEDNGSTIDLFFRFNFHKKQIDDGKNKKIVKELLDNIYGLNIVLSTHLIESDSPIKNSNDSLENVSNIFGKAEVLES